jgi:hypothetical protein
MRIFHEHSLHAGPSKKPIKKIESGESNSGADGKQRHRYSAMVW